MSRERFNIKLEELLSAQEGKNSRTMTDEDHAEAVDFLVSYQASETEPEDGRHRRWLRNLCVADYAGSRKLMRKKSNLEVVKNLKSLIASTTLILLWVTLAETSWQQKSARNASISPTE